MPMTVNVVKIGKTEYVKLPDGWKELVETKINKKINQRKVAMEVNTVLRVFPIDQKGKIIEKE